jgi:hypothetical protein
MRQVRKTSRKGLERHAPRNPQRPYAGPLRFMKRMRWSDPCGDAGRLANTTSPPLERRALGWSSSNRKSEIPCRASSDLHEWRNDLGTVSTRDSAKLQYE